MPATSQLEWLSSTTAMIVLFWSRATRDLLKSFGWGIAALHRLDAATKLPFPRRPPHSVYRSRSAKCSAGRCQIGEGGTKSGGTYRFRSQTAMTAWKAPDSRSVRGGTASSNPASSSGESVATCFLASASFAKTLGTVLEGPDLGDRAAAIALGKRDGPSP